MQENYINVNNLKVSEKLLNFVNDELLKDTEISPDSFWEGFDKVVHELAPKNKELLDIRDQLLGGAADFTNHNNPLRLRVLYKLFEAIDKVCAIKRITSDTNARTLP